jgi:Ca2+:H+ antiporter
MTRKGSSTLQGPHRGQEFSVDDDVSEVEGQLASRTQTLGSSTGYGTIRRQASTLRKRSTAVPVLSRVNSVNEGEDDVGEVPPSGRIDGIDGDQFSPGAQLEDNQDVEDEALYADMNQDHDDGDVSETESFTLKDRQEAINETHPFGIRIWKPALYKKNRSVQKTAEGDIHSSPGGHVSNWLLFFNIIWTLVFGWWLALITFVAAVVCFIFGAAPGAMGYGRVLWGLSGYLFYPFGKFVRLETDDAYAQEDEGEGRSITEYEQWQSGDLEDGRLFFGPETGDRSIIGRRRRSVDSMATETDSLLGRTRRGARRDSSVPRMKRRLFGRGQWNLGRVIFFLFFYGLITPSLFIVSTICWALVFWIPMGKVTLLLFYHLRRHPLALTFQSDTAYSRGGPHSSILLCTYRAVGLKYWKYTVDGTNIFLINLMAVVIFVIVDYWVLLEMLELKLLITHPAFLFVAALFSIIPLAYFIGQAVASISAQSSMGLGAAVNAFFSTLVEVFLYCVALNQGKGQLVEGSIIGSIFAGILFLPGLSMCFGAIKRKTQRFNAKSAGVTSTMLLFAVIAAFGPTLFYQIYGTVSSLPPPLEMFAPNTCLARAELHSMS